MCVHILDPGTTFMHSPHPSGEKERRRMPAAFTTEDPSSLYCCHKHTQPLLLRTLAIFASADYSWQNCLESMLLCPLKWELLLHLCQSRRCCCMPTPTQSQSCNIHAKFSATVDPANHCSHICPDPTPDLLPLHPQLSQGTCTRWMSFLTKASS